MDTKRSRRDDGRGAPNAAEDDPPMSRLFVICSKSNVEQDFRNAFEKFGEIEDIYMVRNKSTSENKGVAYVKYKKTSSAALALEEMNGKTIENCSRPIKVLVASSRNKGSGRCDNEQEKYVRLFVIVPKDVSEEELNDEFEKYGTLENVSIIKDKITKERKGFAYVKYAKFSHAALAFEGCSSKFKAVFAEPKAAARPNASNSQSDRSDVRSLSRYDDNSRENYGGMPNRGFDFHNTFNKTIGGNQQQTETELNIICSAQLNQDQLWRLFDIIPGLEYCQITGECGHSSNYALAVYCSQESAVYAREKLHGIEYPPGERLIIKPIGEGKSHADHSSFNFDGPSKEIFCSVTLPEPDELASPTAACAQRCFIVCVPKALPAKTLINVFSRFGNLIDVYMLQNKNCGYAKFASEESALLAIQTLHMAEVCGVKLKVMEAEEPRDPKRKRYEDA